MYKVSLIDKISFILVTVGAINWGLIGLCNFNLIGVLFGEPANFVGRLIYILIGAAGINMVLFLLKTKGSLKHK
ncbi:MULTISPECIES: DUF378 domain-containing protein [Clostridium]|nr:MULTISPECIES: DUF378 domain-containing protein [Clostridium]EPS47465.1 hypothetical protein CFSAN002369_22233 [Clostridium botulinum CFSAN002369]ABS34620.1 conserved hypothetical protein [Clostridium botulinum A str. ATCC 19397]ABS36449.1 conserved hypothetical protein [Clostridium botulinum A str. Hall]AWB18179.1 DUF378 domain-containing protein [Clostridium botulinum]AWB30956.1 DUF378 domain-containing protein [Clostridium botulinum]